MAVLVTFWLEMSRVYTTQGTTFRNVNIRLKIEPLKFKNIIDCELTKLS